MGQFCLSKFGACILCSMEYMRAPLTFNALPLLFPLGFFFPLAIPHTPNDVSLVELSAYPYPGRRMRATACRFFLCVCVCVWNNANVDYWPMRDMPYIFPKCQRDRPGMAYKWTRRVLHDISDLEVIGLRRNSLSGFSRVWCAGCE